MIKYAIEGGVSCTVNGGFSSNYFDIKQGLRQGSPLSPSLFILGVEILSLAIGQNKNIEGVKIGPHEKKHGQYADDLWSVIRVSQSSFDELIDTFDKFGAISGLNINFDKTEILRIGSLQNSGIKLKSNKPFQWTNCIKILGIHVMANRDDMMKRN